MLELFGRWTQHFTKIDQKTHKIGQICNWTPWLLHLLCKHWIASAWNFYRWVADVPPRETSPAAKSEEKRMFSQASQELVLYPFCTWLIFPLTIFQLKTEGIKKSEEGTICILFWLMGFDSLMVFIRGVARGGGGVLGCPWPPLGRPSFEQTTYNIQVAKMPWQYLGRKSNCCKAHFFKICFFVKYFRQRLLSLVNMGLHAVIIRLTIWRVASVTPPLKNSGYAPVHAVKLRSKRFQASSSRKLGQERERGM